MQEANAPAVQPAAPAAPPSAPAPPVFVATPDGALTLQGLPASPQEIVGLRERREILRDQLERAVNRRSELVRELESATHRGVPEGARTGIQERIAVLDERILQLEYDQALAERLLSNAPPEVLALAAAEHPRYQHTGIGEEELVSAAAGSFVFGVLLVLMIGRVRQRFRRRRGAAQAAGVVAASDERLERLSQAVDAIAVEVERIGEGQRFVTQLLAGPRESLVASEGQRR